MRKSGETACLVTALQLLFKRMGGMPDITPLFMASSGAMVTRRVVSEILKSAAVSLGESSVGMSSHSLRGGGATALYSKGYTREQIMFLGRWRSDSWLIYAKMTKENLGNVAQDLATAHYTVIGKSCNSQVRNSTPGLSQLEVKAWWDPVGG